MKQKKHLIFIMFLSILMTAVVLPSLNAEDEETTDYEVVPCSVIAYIIDKDPAGVNVRSGPGIEYPVIYTFPPCRVPPEYITVSLRIHGSVGEWMYIIDPCCDNEFEGTEFEKIEGWVYGPSIGLRTKAYWTDEAVVPLYEEPSTDSPILARFQSDTGGAIIGCQGKWVKVSIKGIEGWLAPEFQCGAPYTNCC